VERETSGVTAACAMLPRSVFFEIGGTSAHFAMNYNDVDLSMKLRFSGRRIVWTPHARLYHFEGRTRTDPGVGHWEVVLVQQRWRRELATPNCRTTRRNSLPRNSQE